MWSFEKHEEYSISQLIKMIAAENVEGVTILGGEPLDQFDEILQFCSECQKAGFSVMLFTGYELSEIENSDKVKIKSVADILITGRYDESLRTLDHQWIGSTNQQILFLTDRYKNFKIINGNYMEIDIEENGKMTILGFPTLLPQQTLY